MQLLDTAFACALHLFSLQIEFKYQFFEFVVKGMTRFSHFARIAKEYIFLVLFTAFILMFIAARLALIDFTGTFLITAKEVIKKFFVQPIQPILSSCVNVCEKYHFVTADSKHTHPM